MIIKIMNFIIILMISGCYKSIDKQFQPSDNMSFDTGYVTKMGVGVRSDTKTKNPVQFTRFTLEYSEKCDEKGVCGRKHDNLQFSNLESFIENKKNPSLIVFFIHGWHHNASDDSRNYKYFPDLLGRIDDQLHRKKILDPNFDKPDVVGVYIGWPGLVESKIPKFLSVGNRACAADKVSIGLEISCNSKRDKDAYSEMKKDLIRIINKSNSKETENKFLIMGHSFGGRIVSNLFLPDLNEAIEHKKNNILGDNVIISTINPAIGYARFSKIFNNSDIANYPYWINFTSADDDATKKLFPIAKAAGLLKDSGLKTIGHKSDYKTHFLSMRQITSDKPYGCNYNNFEFYSCFSPLRDKYIEGTIPIKSNWFEQTQGYTWYIPMFERNGSSFANQPYKPFRGCKEKEELMHNCIDVEIYQLLLNNINYKKVNKIFYNIEVDSNLIGFHEEHKNEHKNIYSHHNGYISTILLSLLVDRIY